MLAGESLEKIDPGNEQAIDALVEIIKKFDDSAIYLVVKRLMKIDPGNNQGIEALVKSIQNVNNEYHVILFNAFILG